MTKFKTKLLKKLNSLSKHKLTRNLTLYPNKKLITFATNDYLNMSQNKKVIKQVKKSLKKFGLGSCASPLLTGYKSYHKEFEEKIAKFKHKEQALLLNSGYQANLALLSTLPGAKDLILSDSLNHASIIDGLKLSKAKSKVYPHNNIAWIEKFLKENNHYENIFLITEAIFSMDGDIANLREIYSLANNYNIIVILDEAHSTGILGKEGKGIESYYNIFNTNTIIMGTLGKALGSHGAFIAGSKFVISYLVSKARPLIYSTALPPASVIAANYVLDIINNDNSRLEKLKKNIRYFHQILYKNNIPSSVESPIFPIIIGKVAKTLEYSNQLLEKGFIVPAIRPPTVSHNTSRLRISLSSDNTYSQIKNLSQHIIRLIN